MQTQKILELGERVRRTFKQGGGAGSCSLVPAVTAQAGCRGHVHRGTAVVIRDYTRVYPVRLHKSLSSNTLRIMGIRHLPVRQELQIWKGKRSTISCRSLGWNWLYLCEVIISIYRYRNIDEYECVCVCV